MKVIFLSSLFPHEMHSTIVRDSKGPIASANNTLQWALLGGLSRLYPTMSVVNMPHVGAFPFKYKRVFVASAEMKCAPCANCKSVGFLNFVGIKHLSRYYGAKRALSVALRCDSEALLIIYDLHPPFLYAAAKLKQRWPRLKICVVVPDLPGLTGGGTSLLHKIFSRMERSVLNNAYAVIDFFVLLSKHMVEMLPVNGKPFTVVEGIFEDAGLEVVEDYSRTQKVVFYAGSLGERNGVLRLLEAFSKIDRTDYRLVICGDGDTRDAFIAAAARDKRIDYRGQISREEVLRLQRASTLLVNPRTPEGVFTRYSFPSKTMEYLASGVPVLMHALDGIPDEYYEYAFVLRDLDISAMASMIVDICEMDPVVRERKAQRARTFILERKNADVQCLKIAELVAEVSEGQATTCAL